MKSCQSLKPFAFLVAALAIGCGDFSDRTRDDDSDSDSEEERTEKPTPNDADEGVANDDDANDDANDTLPPSQPNEPNEPSEPSEPGEPSEPSEPNEPVAPNEPNECEAAGLVEAVCDGGDIVSCVDGRVERTFCNVGDTCLDDGEARCVPAWEATLAIEAPYFDCVGPNDAFQLVLTSRDAVVVRETTNDFGTVSFGGAEPNGGVIDVPGVLTATISNSVRGVDLVLSFDAGDMSCFALGYEVDTGDGEDSFTALYQHCVADHVSGFYAVVWDLAFYEDGYVEGLKEYKDFLFNGDGDEVTLFGGMYHVDGERLTIAFFNGPTLTGEMIDAETNLIFINEFGDDGRVLSPGQN